MKRPKTKVVVPPIWERFLTRMCLYIQVVTVLCRESHSSTLMFETPTSGIVVKPLVVDNLSHGMDDVFPAHQSGMGHVASG